MRQLWLAAAAACAAAGFAGSASGQVNTMPGQVVGTGVDLGLRPVGEQLPRAGQPVGQPINLPQDSAMMRRYDPTRPYDVFKGTGIRPDQVVAPVTSDFGDKNAFEKMYDKVKYALGISSQPDLRVPNYTPGIGRRNRERAEQRMWRRD
ncbi:MAG TPA: hypothetical protein VM529_18750 [Gemmata sp.]|nr:hypothetical protein [Gemmata sp.]